ncbi:MAG: hypothetical protein AAF648_06085 [Pseudomonadota bacterium]
MIWSLRRWTEAARLRQPVEPILYASHHACGAEDGAEHFDELMCLLAVSAHRKIVVRCGCFKTAHPDEMALLSILRWVQADQWDLAEEKLKTMITGKLVRPFLRTAATYVHHLNGAQLRLAPTASLKVISR